MSLDAIIRRQRPSWLQEFHKAPYTTLAKSLYAQRQRLLKATPVRAPTCPTTIVCVSDTHNSQPFLPPGEILIHAGDLTQSGTVKELQVQLDWLNAQPHQHKVVIAGNHDIPLDEQKSAEFGISAPDRISLRWGSLIYLEHSATKLQTCSRRTFEVYGHPSTPRHDNWAFQYPRGTDVFTQRTGTRVDILVTHSAPRFHLDVAGWGDEYLLQELWRVRPRLHVFGHIHGGFGQEQLIYDRFEELYEVICSGRAGILALFHMALTLLHAWVTASDMHAQRTVLVNASAVGGLHEDERRKAQVITL